MPWYENRGFVFAIIAVVVSLSVFGDKIPVLKRIAQRVRTKWHLLRKKPMKLTLEMPEETAERLELLRQECEKLAGHPVTMDDMVRNAINTYHQTVKQHMAGSTFLLEDRNGHREELHLFEEKAA